MNFRQIIRDYFTFSRSERRGITILLILIFLLAIANKTIFYFETPAKIDTELFDSARHKLALKNDSIIQHNSLGTLFPFNPNKIDSAALESLDIPEDVKRNILKFRQKGGNFYKKADFRKIYGVTDQLFIKIAPYLVLDSEEVKSVPSKPEPVYFVFDPNNASDKEFLHLGFSEKQIVSIRNYMSKAGNFRSKDEFLKIRALTEKQKSMLSDYIEIKSDEKPLQKSPELKNETLLDLNSADSIQLKVLPGIGNVLSKRIVKYRDLLGGFYSEQQLKEVYGLNELNINQLSGKVTFDLKRIRKIDYNFADVKELARHPYLKKNLAEKIVNFRAKYGSIKDLEILRDSMILNIEEYQRLRPYF